MSNAQPHSKHEGLNTRAAGIVAGAVMLSRVLGLARELIFAGLFGAGRTYFVIFSPRGLFRRHL